MALLNPADGESIPPSTQGGLRASPAGRQSVQWARPVNNWSSQSNAFQQMNQRVVLLDAQYEHLAPAVKSEWIAAAAEISDMPVCGCTSELMSGKKLYRLQNFARSLMGLPDVTSPTKGDVQPVAPRFEPFYFQDDDYIESGAASFDYTFFVLLNLGHGLLSPMFAVPVGDYGYIYDASLAAPDLVAEMDLHEGQEVSACWWTTEGFPLGIGIFAPHVI